MESFVWGPNFETGIEDVDSQHRQLVESINRFGTELANNDIASKRIETLLQQLVAYTEQHFKDEEDLMARHRLDTRYCDQHIAEHKSFINDVEFMCQHHREGDSSDGTSLLEFLIHWLAYHILKRDKSMARQIAAIKGGVTPEKAFLVEDQEVSESTEPLLAALNRLFQQVSKRNKELLTLNERLEDIVEERTRALVKANADLEILALTDVLTELPNRRHALLQLHQLWKEANELNGNLACMVIDADGFKAINDTYGHDAGDVVLRRLARELRHSVRSDDIVCRMGGDEFLIICPNTPLDGALYIAELTRGNIASLKVPAGTGAWYGSISVGVAVNSIEVNSVDELLKVADEGVYMAKQAGRNCVRTRQNIAHSMSEEPRC